MPSLANENLSALPHILVVDDDDRIRSLVSRYLRENGFLASTAGNAAEAAGILKNFTYDALVVDVMMPGQSGLEFTRALKKTSDVPVLLLTALGEAGDRIEGLESGADDYLPKPFEPRELVLRLQALLRRRPAAAVAQDFRVGRWVFHHTHGELRDGGEIRRLSPVEANLLRALASNAGKVVSREKLAALCGLESSERTIDVQVTRLRRKLEDDSKRPLSLQTVRGQGYRLLLAEGTGS